MYDQEAYDELLKRLYKGHPELEHNKIICSTNPEPGSEWIYEMFKVQEDVES